MPSFYCLFNSKQTDSLNVEARIALLKKACKKYNVQFCLIDEATADFSNLPVPTADDGLYNCARGSYILERTMLNRNVKSFYRNYNYLSFQDDSNLLCIELEKHRIPIPKTIWKGNNDNEVLKQYVDFLGGFPIVIKTYKGTGGIGVIKIDSFATLFSLADYFVAQRIDFQLKEFIHSKSCERITVLGEKVLYSFTRPIKDNDFRSNFYDQKTKITNFPNEVTELAIQASHLLNLNYAGVDIIFCPCWCSSRLCVRLHQQAGVSLVVPTMPEHHPQLLS